MLPISRPRPESIAKRRDGNQCVASFKITSHAAAVQPPTIARPVQATTKLLVTANSSVPAAVAMEQKISSFRGPSESISIPVGICIRTYA